MGAGGTPQKPLVQNNAPPAKQWCTLKKRENEEREGINHGAMHVSMHGPMHGSMHGPMHGSTHGPMHGSTHGPMHGSTHGPMHGFQKCPPPWRGAYLEQLDLELREAHVKR